MLLILSTGVVFITVAWLSNLEKALASGVIFGIFASIVSVKWESRHDLRFWIIISGFAVIHIVGLTLIDFPELRFGLMSLPFAFADGFIMWGVLNWIEKRFPQSKQGGE